MTHALLNSYRIFNNAWGNMTNPINKKTTEQFVSKINPDLRIEILAEYVNTDTKIEYRCKHGTQSSLPWQILKFKHCCRAGYYESGKMWGKRTNTLDELKDRALTDRTDIDVTECYIDTSSRYKRLANIKCTKHDIYYSSIAANKTGQCPECYKEDNMERLKAAQIAAWASQSTGSFVSKAETKWLDDLNIKDRQVWLTDIQYKVDGFDQSTNTVYLYHGRFWHGCPKTFDPDMIHPVVKLPMKDLYEKTMLYENKIKDAGYNLIVEWGH